METVLPVASDDGR